MTELDWKTASPEEQAAHLLTRLSHYHAYSVARGNEMRGFWNDPHKAYWKRVMEVLGEPINADTDKKICQRYQFVLSYEDGGPFRFDNIMAVSFYLQGLQHRAEMDENDQTGGKRYHSKLLPWERHEDRSWSAQGTTRRYVIRPIPEERP